MKRLSMRAFVRERVKHGDLVTIGKEQITAETLDGFSDDDIKRAVFHGVALKNKRKAS